MNKVYHTTTQKDFNSLMEELEEQGYAWWSSGKKPTEKLYFWEVYKERTCVRSWETGGKAMTFAPCSHFKDRGCKITEYKATKKGRTEANSEALVDQLKKAEGALEALAEDSRTPPAVHDLKIQNEYFVEVVQGSKTFEIRKNDRNFRVGDIVKLREIDDIGVYTGKYTYRLITYITNYAQKEGYVVFSIASLPPLLENVYNILTAEYEVWTKVPLSTEEQKL